MSSLHSSFILSSFPPPLAHVAPVLGANVNHFPAVSISTTPTTIPSTTTPLILPNITTLVSIKLDADNYLLWKSQFEPILICNDLLGYVDGTFPCPPKLVHDSNGALVVNSAYSAWVKTDKCLCSLPNSTMTVEILQEVHDLHTSREIWAALARRFTDHCAVKEIGLKLEFHNATKKFDQSMTDYLRHLKLIADSLTAINCSISNKDLVIQALNGLPPEYDPFVTTVTNGLLSLSFGDLRSRLLIQEQCFLA